MRFKYLIFAVAILGLTQTSYANIAARYVWHKTGYGINESDIRALAIYKNHHPFLLAGTSKALYKANLDQKEFKRVLEVRASDKAINFLYTSPNFLVPGEPSLIFAAANSGLFLSKDEAKTWERIFNSNNASERECQWVATDENYVYLATAGGLFFKDLSASTWTKVSGELSRAGIYLLAQDEEYLYAATDHEVFRVDKEDQSSRKIFSSAAKELTDDASSTEESTDDASDTEDDTQAPAAVRQIKCLTAQKNDSADLLYIVAANGIFLSENQGGDWKNFGIQGLPFDDAVSFIASDDEFYLGTTKGMFRLSGNHVTQIFEGMETNHINFLTRDEDETLYGATDKGLFVLSEKKALSAIVGSGDFFLQEYSAHEPTINDVQKLAVYYAEVNPEKITNWRKAAQRKAWLPKLTAGLNRSEGELYHWDSYTNDPDILRKGKDNLDWDISLVWELGDLVWSGDQSTIDSRSKDTIGLREDILDQVTRLYFERRRLQVELGRQDFEEVVHTDKEMRLAELTALIDGFTGGEFSRRIEQANRDSSHVSRDP